MAGKYNNKLGRYRPFSSSHFLRHAEVDAVVPQEELAQRNRKATVGKNGNSGNNFFRLLSPHRTVVPVKALALVHNHHKRKILVSYVRPFRFRRFGRSRAPELMRSLVNSERLL